MKIHVPELARVAPSTPQGGAMDKLGGLPWGLPATAWPLCRLCRRSMSLIAQLFHDDERLDLGAPGRCLFVFMCATPESACGTETFDPDIGCNASFVLEPGQLGSGLTCPPDAGAAWPVCSVESMHESRGSHRDKIWVQRESRVVRWLDRHEDVDAAYAGDFLDPQRFPDVAARMLPRVYRHTKLGGVPRWLQDPEVPDGWVFCAQFSNDTGPNYGTGMAYLFLSPGKDAPPACRFFWQC
jgi:hypothetical protein